MLMTPELIAKMEHAIAKEFILSNLNQLRDLKNKKSTSNWQKKFGLYSICSLNDFTVYLNKIIREIVEELC